MLILLIVDCCAAEKGQLQFSFSLEVFLCFLNLLYLLKNSIFTLGIRFLLWDPILLITAEAILGGVERYSKDLFMICNCFDIKV